MEQQFFTIRIERQETRMERLERRKRETRKSIFAAVLAVLAAAALFAALAATEPVIVARDCEVTDLGPAPEQKRKSRRTT